MKFAVHARLQDVPPEGVPKDYCIHYGVDQYEEANVLDPRFFETGKDLHLRPDALPLRHSHIEADGHGLADASSGVSWVENRLCRKLRINREVESGFGALNGVEKIQKAFTDKSGSQMKIVRSKLANHVSMLIGVGVLESYFPLDRSPLKGFLLIEHETTTCLKGLEAVGRIEYVEQWQLKAGLHVVVDCVCKTL